MSDRDLFNQLDQLVNGPPLLCSCGGGAGHYYEVHSGVLMEVVVENSTDAPQQHSLYAEGRMLLNFRLAPGALFRWTAPTKNTGVVLWTT